MVTITQDKTEEAIQKVALMFDKLSIAQYHEDNEKIYTITEAIEEYLFAKWEEGLSVRTIETEAKLLHLEYELQEANKLLGA